VAWRGGLEAERPAVDCVDVSTIDRPSSLPPGDDDLLEMVQETFDGAREALGTADARRYIREREEDLYRHLESIGLEEHLPRVRAVYAAFWQIQAGM
jgi:hypothetical protein